MRGFVALVALMLVATSCGSAANDPDAFGVHFDNDLGRQVLLALCNSDHSDRCADPPYRDRIAPRSSEPENIAPGVETEWAVEDTHGALLRCVVLYWRHFPGYEPHVRLSAAPSWSRPCLPLVYNTAPPRHS